MRVRVRLDPPRPNTQPWRLSNPSQSLLFRFRTGSDEEMLAGAILDVEGGVDVSPGDEFIGWLEFWAEDIKPLLNPGESFDVWYGGDVGSGEVLDFA